MAIFAHSHIGHTPGVGGKLTSKQFALACQVESAIQAFDAVKKTFGAHVKIVLAGHSVGAWVTTQVRSLLEFL
jgi:hypothetical protein